MEIRVDEEGQRAIQLLCDVALRSKGAEILPTINLILTSTKKDDHQNVNDD